MKFLNILTELWCKPWVIIPEMHVRLCEIVQAHINGAAHNPDGIAQMWSQEAKKDDDECGYRVDGNVAIVPLQGVIGKRVSAMQKSSGVMDIDDLIQDIEKAAADESVKGIFLDVASPGGSVTGQLEAAKVIRTVGKTKPVVAFTDTMMASGAYWLSSAATEIVATKTSITGSIGVYMAWLDDSRGMEMRGERTELIKHGKFKATGIRGIPLTEEQRALLQAEVDKVYGWFAADVRLGRGTVSDATMEGQSFYGDEALRKNLIDKIGDADVAMNELRGLMKTEDE